MANLQPQFDGKGSFNEAIQLGRFDKEQKLRDKRDIIRRRLENNLPGVFAKHNEPAPEFWFRDQGSYGMKTGIKPLPGGSGYDIDQGLYFATSVDGIYAKSPLKLKERVLEALNGLTTNMRIRRPCVTVYYKENGEEEAFHVDIAVYSAASSNSDAKDYLAVARAGASAEEQEWKVSDPAGLKEELFRRFEDDTLGRWQFRRMMRYLKRWKDFNFASTGNGAPRGIGLTINTHHGFEPAYSDRVARVANDLEALRSLVNYMLGQFRTQWREKKQELGHCMVAKLPVEPWSDVYENMTLVQMTTFESKLKDLKAALDYAANEVEPDKACERLRKVFGDNFPVPPKTDTSRKTSAGVSSSGISG
jgi:hypothetical protein